ncbi:DNA polymerase III subunit delta' [Latilactobacillus sakei]|nr:DNA polymerase III subunit delta' [Latilactobacillus sakei]AUX11197.1 DNA polymerase III subunit delta' [Latilactobacillus sakei]
MATLTIEQMQPKLVQQFAQIVARGQLAHGYLLAGAQGVGKMQLAQWLALRLFCQQVNEDSQPCYQCPECQRILTGNHPDVVEIKPDGKSIKIADIRYLKQEVAKSGMESSQRLFIIEAAETLTASAANSLLKFLEEPAPNVYAILCTSNKNLMLPTILSRLQVIDLANLPKEMVRQQFEAAQILPAQAQLLSHLTSDLTQAQQLLAEDWLMQVVAKITSWAQKVAQKDLESFVAIQTQLLPLLADRSQQKIALNLIGLWYQDLLNCRYDLAGDLCFSEYRPQLNTISQQMTAAEIVAQTEFVLTAQRTFEQNVSCQNVLESLTLNLIAVA